MAEGGEMRGFVFAVIFIIVFSSMISSIPVGFQGSGGTVETIIPVNPNLLSDFADSESFQPSDFDAFDQYWYPAPLGGYEYICGYLAPFDTFTLAKKAKFFGIWFGAFDAVDFKFDNGTTAGGGGGGVTFAELDDYADDGVARFSIVFEVDGTTAGNFLSYWNTTTYGTDSEAAWNGDGLYFLHGIGMTANTDIASLLISLLFLQLPEVPTLVNVFLATPLWACIVYVLWFIIKEMIPFL